MNDTVNVNCYFANVNELHKCSGAVICTINDYPFLIDYEFNIKNNSITLNTENIPASWYDALGPIKEYIRNTVYDKLSAAACKLQEHV